MSESRYQNRLVLKSGYFADTLPSGGEWVLYQADDGKPYLAVIYYDTFRTSHEREFEARKLYGRVWADLSRDVNLSGPPTLMAAIVTYHPLTHFPGTIITNHRDFNR